MKKFASFVLLSLLASSASLSSQEILILGIGGDLHSVDPNSGDATFIGLTGLQMYFWPSMAIDSQGRLFAAYGRDDVGYGIYEINPNTGHATFVVQTNLGGPASMAFGPGDVLYVGNDRTAPTIPHKFDLYTLDLSTGVDTFIGAIGATNVLAMNYSQGTLWGYAGIKGLIQIDPATGASTDVNPNFTGPQNATVSFCFDEEGAIYYIDGVLWMLDSETGVASAVNYASPFGFWGEAVFIDGPTPHFSLWLSGVTDGSMSIKLAGATPFGQIAVAFAQGTGGPTAIPAGHLCAGTALDLNAGMRIQSIVTADSEGKAAIGPQFVPAAALGLVRLQAIDLTTCETSNRVIVSY